MIMKGTFLSDGTAKNLVLPFGVTWIKTKNVTVYQAAGAGTLATAAWQKDNMRYDNDPTHLIYGTGENKTAVTDALAATTLDATHGFLEYDSGSDNPLGTVLACTNVTAADPPLVLAGDTGTIAEGDIVRFRSVTGATQLNGLDFTVGTVVANVSIELPYMRAIVAGTDGFFYPVKYQDIFYPRTRVISEITLGTSTVVEMTVAHGFAVGDLVRLLVPTIFGTRELNNVAVEVTAIAANTITVDYDSTGFTAFTWPLTGTKIPIYAQVVPMSPATMNSGEFGLILHAGNAAPAGVDGDYISWIAGDDGIDIY